MHVCVSLCVLTGPTWGAWACQVIAVGCLGWGKLPQLRLGSELAARQGEVKVPKPPPGFPVPRLVIHSKVPCTETVSESGKPLSCTISFLFSSS